MSTDSHNGREIDDAIQIIMIFCRRENCTPEEAAERLHFVDSRILASALSKIDEIAKGIILGPGGPAVIHGENPLQPWYIGPQPGDVYWPSLREKLKDEGWDEESLGDLDVSSTKVLANLANPATDPVNTRGLVLGYIQSGKTTNFTAVISKAADAGYRMFIVLSGVSNPLRRQTQLRLTEQLVQLNPLNWSALTDELRDMGRPINFQFAGLAQPGVRTLAVVKKESHRLKNLIDFLKLAKDAGALTNCPILVIDDEADQASLSPDLTPEKRNTINDLIVSLLRDFPKVAYVAYTATPFANFFVDPSYPDNLYPRNFIIPLPEPSGYFGPRMMFGVSDQDDPELDVIRLLPDNEDVLLTPPRGRGNRFEPQLTSTVVTALRWFFLATTVRRLMANGVQPHSTMMIHTSERVAQHTALWVVIRDGIEEMRTAVKSGDNREIAAFTELWNLESSIVDPHRFGHVLPSIESILGALGETLDEIGDLSSPDNESCGLIIDNGKAERRLLYDNDAPKPVIVIGGNTLSRGLTLEGLVSSVFTRSVNLYDSLLQMGRWFGYRRGYESLPRVWMPRHVASKFGHLSRIEMEIREEVERYAETNITPLNLAVRIRTHPAMAITRAQMMRAVRRVRLDYSGTEVDTVYLYNNLEWLQRNLAATKILASSCLEFAGAPEAIRSSVLFRGVPASVILEFLDRDSGYRVQPAAGARFTQDGVRDYIKDRLSKGELSHWNVAFIGTDGGARFKLCETLTIGLSQRGRDGRRSSGTMVSIGDHLAGREDRSIDLPTNPNRNEPSRVWRDRQDPREPLLLVQVVDKDSKAQQGGLREDLAIVEHFAGIAIGFPTSSFEVADGFAEVELPDAFPEVADEIDDVDEVVDVEGSADDVIGVNNK